MTKKPAAAAALLALTLAFAGCGGGDEKGDADRPAKSAQSETGTPDDAATPSAADQAAAEAALLTLDDFPSGWEAKAADEEDDDEESQRRIADCVGVDYEDLYLGDSKASADSQTFVSASDEEISNSVNIAADEDWAANVFEIASGDKFRDCMLEELSKTLEDSVSEEDGVEVGDPSINEISFDDYGDDTIALRVTIPVEAEGLSLEITSDFIFVRVGRAQTMLNAQSMGTPFDTETLSGLTKIAADRLAEKLA